MSHTYNCNCSSHAYIETEMHLVFLALSVLFVETFSGKPNIGM